MRNTFWLFLIFASVFTFEDRSFALPAFALREHVSCTLCHTNGSAPHLTKTGYMYRRAGFRFPSYIGNLEKDNESLQLSHHMAAGINVDYEAVTQKSATQSESLVSNDINVREVEIWPVVGAFLGSYGAWSELDMAPATPGDRTAALPPNTTTPAAGGAEITQADLRYVSGSADVFFNMRAGLMAPEGFGASDQWIDDGNLPLFDTLSAQFNQDTLTLPLGAMGNPQMGAEFGFNYYDSHLTLGTYNGFDGTNGLANQTQSQLTPALMSNEGKGDRDYKAQLDQFLGDQFALTGVYYNGRISLLDPANTMVWQNNYQLYRFYVTYMAIPNLIDVLGGAAYGQYDYVNAGSNTIAGMFNNRGSFIGANYYMQPHLTLSGRLDYYQYVYGVQDNPRAQGYSLMASLPYDNTIFVFHFMQTDDEIAGLRNDFRIEWRFLF